MCGRYYIENDGELREIIEMINRQTCAVTLKTGATSRALKPSAFAMSWGYSLPDGKKVINARSESAQTKPLFRDGMLQRRCAIPASGYFDWERTRPQKTKYAIRPTGSATMYMAGIYRIENALPVFAILTREPAKNISFIHDRMPVILPTDRISDWINPKYDAGDLIRNAILDVRYESVGGTQWEQIGMEL